MPKLIVVDWYNSDGELMYEVLVEDSHGFRSSLAKGRSEKEALDDAYEVLDELLQRV